MYFFVEKYKRAGKRPPVFAKTAQCQSTVIHYIIISFHLIEKTSGVARGWMSENS